MRKRKFLVLLKGADKYMIRYEEGRESGVLRALIDYAKDDRLNLGWAEILHVLKHHDTEVFAFLE